MLYDAWKLILRLIGFKLEVFKLQFSDKVMLYLSNTTYVINIILYTHIRLIYGLFWKIKDNNFSITASFYIQPSSHSSSQRNDIGFRLCHFCWHLAVRSEARFPSSVFHLCRSCDFRPWNRPSKSWAT